jgi:hypothetical protein
LVEPPRKFDELDAKSFPKALDWFRFREFMLNEYLAVLEDIFASYTVEPLLFRSLYFKPGDLLPAFNLVPEDRSPFLGANVFPEGSYFDLANKARFLKGEYGFAFASSFSRERPRPIEARRRDRTDRQRFGSTWRPGWRRLKGSTRCR